MKLFLYDEKHEQVIAQYELGDLTVQQNDLLEDVILFLDDQGVLNRYKTLIIAKNYKQVTNEV